MISDRRLLKSFLVAAVFTAFLFAGCGKFDRSSIKMPEIKLVTPENLHSISSVDSGHTWVCGNYGTILFSADSGRTWQQQDSGINEYLLDSIVFTDIKNGWAVGVNGTVIHTADSGKTWVKQKSGTNSNLLDLFLLIRIMAGQSVSSEPLFTRLMAARPGEVRWRHRTPF